MIKGPAGTVTIRSGISGFVVGVALAPERGVGVGVGVGGRGVAAGGVPGQPKISGVGVGPAVTAGVVVTNSPPRTSMSQAVTPSKRPIIMNPSMYFTAQ